MIGRLFRRRRRPELALATDRHFPPAPRTPPPPPSRPDLTDRDLLESIHEKLDRLTRPWAYWQGGPR